MATIEDVCHTHVSHELLYHLDTCAGSVQASRGSVINVQKRLGDRDYNGEGGCRLCGTFFDRQLEQREICRSHSRQESPQNPEDSQKRNPNRLLFSLPLHCQAAVRLWTCVCVSSFNAAAAAVRGDAAQAGFEPKTSHYRREIPELRAYVILHQPPNCSHPDLKLVTITPAFLWVLSTLSMDQHALQLEELFEDHGICSYTISNSLSLKRVVYERHSYLQTPPTALQLIDWQRSVQLLLDLTVTNAFPAQTSEFALQVIQRRDWLSRVR